MVHASVTGGLLFVGCGAIAAAHSRTLARMAPEVPRFYASRDAARAADYAQAHGGAGSYGDYREALADARADTVIVTTPPGHHLDRVLAALEAGKDVVVEKPAFATSAQARRARDAAHAAGRRVLVAENYAYRPLLCAVRSLVTAGELGDVRFVVVNAVKRQAATGWRADPALAGGGALLEGGVHWISFLAGLGLEVESATGAPTGGAVDRGAAAVLRYRGGATGVLLYSWEIPSVLGGARLSRVYGTRGSAVFESNGAFLASWSRRPRLAVPDLRDATGTKAMWRALLTALRDGHEPPYALADATRDIELVERILSPP